MHWNNASQRDSQLYSYIFVQRANCAVKTAQLASWLYAFELCSRIKPIMLGNLNHAWQVQAMKVGGFLLIFVLVTKYIRSFALCLATVFKIHHCFITFSIAIAIANVIKQSPVDSLKIGSFSYQCLSLLEIVVRHRTFSDQN